MHRGKAKTPHHCTHIQTITDLWMKRVQGDVSKREGQFICVDSLYVTEAVEGGFAQGYWKEFQPVMPETFCLSRKAKSHQYNASDPFNLCLNYAYGVIEGCVRRAINIIGLEPAVGFLHEFTGSHSKESLVYDLMESFRWLGDVTTIEAFESGALDMKDFYFLGDDYRYHIEIEAKRRFLELLKNRFNSGIRYKGKTWKWDTVILNKTQELARFLLPKSDNIDFLEPSPDLRRSDVSEIRRRILELTQGEAKRLGISKSTLHYVQKKARSDRPFRLYSNTKSKLSLSPLSHDIGDKG